MYILCAEVTMKLSMLNEVDTQPPFSFCVNDEESVYRIRTMGRFKRIEN